jgi:hypothetical protein
MSIYELLLARPDVATISTKSRQAKHRWWLTERTENEAGEKTGDVLTLACHQWADRKQFSANLGVSNLTVGPRGLSESFWVLGSSTVVLRAPIPRYSAKAFEAFIEQALQAARTEEVAARIEAIIAKNAEMVRP